MSMNLVFFKANGRDTVDFPFQTPTDLSFAVLRAGSTKERLVLIETQLKIWKYSKEEINTLLIKIERMLGDTSLRLAVI